MSITGNTSIRRSRLSGLAIAAAVAVMSASTAITPVLAQATNPVRGGTMTIINGSDIKSWDPAITSGTFPGGPMDALDAVYGFLVYINADGVVTGGMAQGLTSTDAITWTLKLRPGMKFTDGNPYDAEAVKFNWDRAADPATLAPTQGFVSSWNKGITVVDPTTLTVKLPAPNANFAAQVAELVPFIASPAALKAAAQKTDIKPVGAGAFTLTSWDQGISMTLARNPGYWDQPRPYLDTLKFAIIPETNARIATVVQGGATMMAGYPYQFGTNNKAPGVAQLEIPIRGFNRGFFNQASGVFTDVRARQAFYYGIDRTKLMQAFTQTDLYKAPIGYFGTKSPYFDGSLPLPGYDAAKAQSLIDQLAAEGKPFNIKLVTYPNSDLKRLTGFVQQVISTYKGASATIVEVDQALLPERCKAETSNICFEGGVQVSNGAEPTISNLLRSTGPLNLGQYKSPAMDAALTEASSTVDQAAVKAAYVKVQKLLADDLPLYIFGEQTRFLLLRNNTGGVVNSNGGILQKQFLYVCPDVCVK
ncbi:ABC transporter substrate-binding protein [soil metagenome]